MKESEGIDRTEYICIRKNKSIKSSFFFHFLTGTFELMRAMYKLVCMGTKKISFIVLRVFKGHFFIIQNL